MLGCQHSLNNWVTVLVSPSFLGRFAFDKGISNLLIMLLPILAFSLVEIASIKYEFRMQSITGQTL